MTVDMLLRFLVAVAVGIPLAALVVITLRKIFAWVDGNGVVIGTPIFSPSPFTVAFGDETYRGHTVSDVGVAILDVDAASVIDLGYGMAKSDGTFMVVTVAIENQQPGRIEMSPSLFGLVDEAGNVYSASPKSHMGSMRINSGNTKIETVAFDIPTVITKRPLALRFRGGKTGDTSELPLLVQTVEKVSQRVHAAAEVFVGS
jgi:hypothetical protein